MSQQEFPPPLRPQSSRAERFAVTAIEVLMVGGGVLSSLVLLGSGFSAVGSSYNADFCTGMMHSVGGLLIGLGLVSGPAMIAFAVLFERGR
jgi:hypothetical protein